MPDIRKVGVVGAGVMGAGIAAQVANAGVPVVLLDIVREGARSRSAVAEEAVARMLKTDPAPFMSPAAAKLVTTGNIEDDLGLLAECDWIIEAVVERPDVKQALYRKLDRVRRPGTGVSSNTSTIPLAALVHDMPDAFARDFLITHFFNPPRYMRLLELVTGPQTDAALVEQVSRFADVTLGKSVVRCKDTPGFIANRIGTLWLQLAVIEAIEQKIEVETADAVIGRPFGIPKTGVFGLLDLVGIDLMPHINASMSRTLPTSDAFHGVARDVPLVNAMIADGRTGRKGKGGFYRMARGAGGAKMKEALDLGTGAYRPSVKADVPEIAAAAKDLRRLMEAGTPAGRYAWAVMGKTLAYAASLVPEIADDIASVDEAMRLGYNWKRGPFELIDQLGAAWFARRLAAEGADVPPLLKLAGDRSFCRVENGQLQSLGTDGAYRDLVRPDGVLRLEDVKRRSKPLLRNGSASLWDIGDGVACFEFTGKGNSLDEQVMQLLAQSIPLVAEKMKALVIYNEGQHFSVGANL
ncbi:MAG: 3-hydroxyacyl-CoA dehydrogenase, partial [Acetobacteraceae bacterium]|nr:3-hydroxyacyl-CoA dehydrogenase [Acetobacteraceae bacterium]